MDRTDHIITVYQGVSRFAREMRKELLKEKNLKKEHWSKCKPYHLLCELHNKLHEMREREDDKELWGGRMSKARMRKLAVHIGNFAMMLNEHYKPKPRRKKAK